MKLMKKMSTFVVALTFLFVFSIKANAAETYKVGDKVIFGDFGGHVIEDSDSNSNTVKVYVDGWNKTKEEWQTYWTNKFTSSDGKIYAENINFKTIMKDSIKNQTNASINMLRGELDNFGFNPEVCKNDVPNWLLGENYNLYGLNTIINEGNYTSEYSLPISKNVIVKTHAYRDDDIKRLEEDNWNCQFEKKLDSGIDYYICTKETPALFNVGKAIKNYGDGGGIGVGQIKKFDVESYCTKQSRIANCRNEYNDAKYYIALNEEMGSIWDYENATLRDDVTDDLYISNSAPILGFPYTIGYYVVTLDKSNLTRVVGNCDDYSDSYKITYETNGGDKIDAVSVTGNKELTTPKRDGYIFDGWYTDSNFTTKISSITPTQKKTDTCIAGYNDVTVYAKWKKELTSDKVSVLGEEKSLENVSSIAVKLLDKVTANIVGTLKTFTAYDITLKDADGKSVEPSGKVKLSLEIPKDYDKNNIGVYRVDGEKLIEYKATINGEYAEIETNHFSTYIVGEKAEVKEEEKTTTKVTNEATSKDNTNIQNPKTGDNMTIFFIVGLLLVGGIIIVCKRLKESK